MAQKFILILVVFLFTPTWVNAQLIQNPEPTLRDATDEDFLAKNYPTRRYNELYTYQIQLDNGVQIIYTFSINDFGKVKSRVSGAKMAVTWLDGKNYIANKEYSIDTFINEADSNKIILHPERNYWAKGSFEDEHVINFRTTKDGVAYDIQLILYDIAKGKVLGNGVYHLDGKEMGMYLLIPHSKVKGYVSINGKKIDARGTASMDHVYQKHLANEIVENGYRIKSGDDNFGYYLNFITYKKDGDLYPIGYGIKYENGKANLIVPKKIITNDEKGTHGVKLHTSLTIEIEDKEPLQFKVTEHFNSYSILDELGGIKKTLAKRFLGGEIVEMNGIGLLQGKPAYFSFIGAN